jgi:glycosyltransferase involved in cell wall biosynthesis
MSIATPRVSVVMSVYNDVRRLRASVESILGQSLTELEFIIVDDGATDGSGNLLDTFARQDERVRVIHQPNSGLTRALIRGCALAKAPYIARQDADDRSHPDRLAEQVELLDSDDSIGFVSCWTDYVGPENEPLETVTRSADPQMASHGLLHDRLGPPAHGSVMFRRGLYEQVGGYRPEFYFGQDSDLWLRMAERTLIGYVPRVLYEARREMESVSGSLRPLQKEFGLIGNSCSRIRRDGKSDHAALARARELTARIRADRAIGQMDRSHTTNMAYLIAAQLTRNGDRRATRYLLQVLRSRPWHWKAWARLLQLPFTSRGDLVQDDANV